MTTIKAERAFLLYRSLTELGFTFDDIKKLLGISRQLSKWDTDLCNGDVSIDETTGTSYRHYGSATRHPMVTVTTPNRAEQALKRLAAIMAPFKSLCAYHQTDPRGCALYILRKRDVKGHDIHQVYTRGVAVCL